MRDVDEFFILSFEPVNRDETLCYFGEHGYIFYTQIGVQTNTRAQIDSSTIDGNVEFVHSQYSCILCQVSIQFLCLTKLSIIVTILE